MPRNAVMTVNTTTDFYSRRKYLYWEAEKYYLEKPIMFE